jgi:hypothetical protein
MDYEKLKALADQCICHPVSRSIDDIEAAGGAINELLSHVDRLESQLADLLADAGRREWTAIDYAPHDRRILVKAESGEIYAAHWVQCPMTGDEAFCVSEAADGTQHLVRPVEWREIV